jgi:transposase
MAMTIVEMTRPVTGGVDTHLDVHVAAAVDAAGGVLGVESFATTAAGFARLHEWLSSVGPVRRVGVEGTGAYGAGLARYLRGQHLEVVEVDRPNRQQRRRAGKSDTVDAIEAARAALSGRASGIAKTADGNAEAIRALLIAKRSARDTRIMCLNQIRHLGFTAPDALRERFRGVSRRRLAHTAAALRPTAGSDVVTHATKLALQTLGRRVVDLDATTERIDEQLTALVRSTAPDLLGLEGVESTRPRSCWSPPVTIRNGCGAKPRSRTSAVSHRSKHRQARRSGIDSTGVGTARRTMRCGGSCSPACTPMNAPANTWRVGSPRGGQSPRSSGS